MREAIHITADKEDVVALLSLIGNLSAVVIRHVDPKTVEKSVLSVITRTTEKSANLVADMWIATGASKEDREVFLADIAAGVEKARRETDL
ncbi:MAG: hypothetical protein B6D36_01095 [Planctomycetes bacterium UTPLA1]|nr:MAG: hypothetical protein B6D36_01095 [Planctomycetes bacterium UTPLA1]